MLETLQNLPLIKSIREKFHTLYNMINQATLFLPSGKLLTLSSENEVSFQTKQDTLNYLCGAFYFCVYNIHVDFIFACKYVAHFFMIFCCDNGIKEDFFIVSLQFTSESIYILLICMSSIHYCHVLNCICLNVILHVKIYTIFRNKITYFSSLSHIVFACQMNTVTSW